MGIEPLIRRFLLQGPDCLIKQGSPGLWGPGGQDEWDAKAMLFARFSFDFVFVETNYPNGHKFNLFHFNALRKTGLSFGASRLPTTKSQADIGNQRAPAL